MNFNDFKQEVFCAWNRTSMDRLQTKLKPSPFPGTPPTNWKKPRLLLKRRHDAPSIEPVVYECENGTWEHEPPPPKVPVDSSKGIIRYRDPGEVYGAWPGPRKKVRIADTHRTRYYEKNANANKRRRFSDNLFEHLSESTDQNQSDSGAASETTVENVSETSTEITSEHLNSNCQLVSSKSIGKTSDSSVGLGLTGLTTVSGERVNNSWRKCNINVDAGSAECADSMTDSNIFNSNSENTQGFYLNSEEELVSNSVQNLDANSTVLCPELSNCRHPIKNIVYDLGPRSYWDYLLRHFSEYGIATIGHLSSMKSGDLQPFGITAPKAATVKNVLKLYCAKLAKESIDETEAIDSTESNAIEDDDDLEEYVEVLSPTTGNEERNKNSTFSHDCVAQDDGQEKTSAEPDEQESNLQFIPGTDPCQIDDGILERAAVEPDHAEEQLPATGDVQVEESMEKNNTSNLIPSGESDVDVEIIEIIEISAAARSKAKGRKRPREKSINFVFVDGSNASLPKPATMKALRVRNSLGLDVENATANDPLVSAKSGPSPLQNYKKLNSKKPRASSEVSRTTRKRKAPTDCADATMSIHHIPNVTQTKRDEQQLTSLGQETQISKPNSSKPTSELGPIGPPYVLVADCLRINQKETSLAQGTDVADLSLGPEHKSHAGKSKKNSNVKEIQVNGDLNKEQCQNSCASKPRKGRPRRNSKNSTKQGPTENSIGHFNEDNNNNAPSISVIKSHDQDGKQLSNHSAQTEHEQVGLENNTSLPVAKPNAATMNTNNDITCQQAENEAGTSKFTIPSQEDKSILLGKEPASNHSNVGVHSEEFAPKKGQVSDQETEETRTRRTKTNEHNSSILESELLTMMQTWSDITGVDPKDIRSSRCANAIWEILEILRKIPPELAELENLAFGIEGYALKKLLDEVLRERNLFTNVNIIDCRGSQQKIIKELVKFCMRVLSLEERSEAQEKHSTEIPNVLLTKKGHDCTNKRIGGSEPKDVGGSNKKAVVNKAANKDMDEEAWTKVLNSMKLKSTSTSSMVKQGKGKSLASVDKVTRRSLTNSMEQVDTVSDESHYSMIVNGFLGLGREKSLVLMRDLVAQATATLNKSTQS